MSFFSKIVASVVLVNGFAMAGNGLLIGGGLNLSSISFSEDLPDGVKESRRTGFNLGAALEIGIVPMFSIVPGVSLETRGQELKVSDPDFGDVKSEAKLMYLLAPVLAQVNIPVGHGFFNLYAGPELGFLLSAKQKISGDPSVVESGEEDMKDDTKAIDFAVHIGLGFEFPVGPGAIAFRPGYSFSLTDFDDTKPDPDFPDEPHVEVTHTNIKLAVAYKISL